MPRKPMGTPDLDALEELLDYHGLEYILTGLAYLSLMKSNDKKSPRSVDWRKAANVCESAAQKVNNINLS